MKKIKIGIIGCGDIAGRRHIPGHREVDGVSIIAACDIDETRAKAFAKEYDIPYTFTDHEKLVEMDELDAVSICTTNNNHAKTTIAALNAGKHVLCEKPMAVNAIEGQAMVDAQKASGKVLQIGLQFRFQDESRTLRKFYDEGFFGDIYYARAVKMRRRSLPPAQSFLKKNLAGGGALIDIGVHILDVLLWIIGCPKPIEAFGMTATKFGHRPEVMPMNKRGAWNHEGFEVEDFAMGTIRFEGELTVTLETAWASHIQDVSSAFLIGDLAGATYEPLEIDLDKKSEPVQLYLDKKNSMVNYAPELLRGLPGEFESFHKAIREDLPSPVSAEEVLNVAKIFDALYESARIGRSVRIM